MKEYNELSSTQKGYLFDHLQMFFDLYDIRGAGFLHDSTVPWCASVDKWFHLLLFISDVTEDDDGCRMRSEKTNRPVFNR
jgi:hypothetical protein